MTGPTASARPRVSVLMGVYNCAATLPAALDSILAQTFTDWELIVCDDASSDGSRDVLAAYACRDPRIVVLVNDSNRTLAPTLNRCLSEARGEFVARMDGDDLSAPARLARQVAYLDQHPDIAVVSSATTFFDDEGTWGVSAPKELPNAQDLQRGVPFCHPAAMMRRRAIVEIGGYSEAPDTWRVEDFRLWIDLYRAGQRGANILDPLYHFRSDRDGYARRTWRARTNEARAIRLAQRTFGSGLLDVWRPARPLIVALLPYRMYRLLHHRRHARQAARC